MCGVAITISRVATAGTAKHPITERLALLRCLRHRATGATLLRRVGGWDQDDLHASAFRLAVQDAQESAPPNIMRRLRQPRACDALDVERFVHDQAVLADELASDLVVKVAPLIGDVQVLLGETLYRLLAPMAPLLRARDSPLRASQGCLGFAIVARRGNLSPVHRHQEGFEAKINPGGW